MEATGGIRERCRRLLTASRPTPRRGGAVLAVAVAACAVGLGPGAVLAQVQPTYLYSLASFTGPHPYSWVRFSVDQERSETYVIYQNLVRIFNANGMEVFSFGDDLDLGQIADLAVDQHGDIIVLSLKDGRPLVTRCNFRGVPMGPVEITHLPAGLQFGANRLIHRNGSFYFVSSANFSVIVTDANGEFRQHIDFRPMLEADERQKTGAEIFGISVDKEGNIFFTVPVLFKAYKFSPDGKLTSFGRPGSAPGRFGVAGGIVADSRGNVLVVDKLRCVVMVFDKDFNFLTEFGYRGPRPENLIAPDDIAIDKRDRVYLTQGRRRGISVFALTGE